MLKRLFKKEVKGLSKGLLSYVNTYTALSKASELTLKQIEKRYIDELRESIKWFVVNDASTKEFEVYPALLLPGETYVGEYTLVSTNFWDEKQKVNYNQRKVSYTLKNNNVEVVVEMFFFGKDYLSEELAPSTWCPRKSEMVITVGNENKVSFSSVINMKKSEILEYLMRL